MQRTVQQITQQLISLLPTNDQYYRLEEFRNWGFPSFIVQRIKIELERNLAESMVIPKTDWANTQSDAVLNAWQQFVDAIRAEARLPASYAQTVIETAVADVMDMLVQPRKNIPEVIFGAKDKLAYEEVCERVKSVVVYRHFCKLIPRYMEKKELDTLTKQRCAKIVSDADQKLTARYSPLNWAQMLEPLFKLVEGEIDTNLLRLFFEDKNMPRIARQFDLMNDSLTRAELIETLSSPSLLDFEGYEDEQSNLFGDQPTSPTASQADRSSDKKDGDLQEDRSEDLSASEEQGNKNEEQSEKKKERKTSQPEEKNNLNTDFGQHIESENNPEEVIEDANSLNAVFVEEDESDADPNEREESPAEAEGSESEEELVERESEKGQDPVQQESQDDVSTAEEEENKSDEKEETSSANGQDSDVREEETPMWMRYMSEEEIEEYKERQQEESDEQVEEGFIDEPIVDLTNEDATEKEVNKLKEQLSGDREMFVEEIFKGSDRAFDEAVEKIAAYDSWRDVSKYIEKDIFKRNLVDMYSEAAVDFTDRLQSYFLEKRNQKK